MQWALCGQHGANVADPLRPVTIPQRSIQQSAMVAFGCCLLAALLHRLMGGRGLLDTYVSSYIPRLPKNLVQLHVHITQRRANVKTLSRLWHFLVCRTIGSLFLSLVAQIMHVNMSTTWQAEKIEEVYSNNGTEISGLNTVVKSGDDLLIGTMVSDAYFCVWEWERNVALSPRLPPVKKNPLRKKPLIQRNDANPRATK